MVTTTATADTAVLESFFQALGRRDLAAVGELFHEDASWNHRNNDRFGGIHQGSDGIVGFMVEAAQLTAGTMRPEPQSIMADGDGRVCVLVRFKASRPDGRSVDNPQVLMASVDNGRIRAVDHYVGDPAAVTAFWA